MWTLTDGTTDVITIPTAGVITVDKPPGVKVSAFVNGQDAALHHLHVKAGDTVSFKVKSKSPTNEVVAIEYAGDISKLKVAGMPQEKEDKMDTSNLFAVPTSSGMGGAIGGGLGAGLLGGVLGGALLGGNNGGLFGGNRGVVPVTTEGVESIVNNSSIQQALGDIKAAIPFNEGQVQLALAATQADINSNINNASTNINSAISTQALATASGFANLNTNLGNSLANITSTVNTTSASNLAATMQASKEATANSWALTQAINNDGDKTRALIQSIDKTNDSRLITNLSNEVIELRGDQRLTAATGNITISNNNAATANAQQQQAQQQQQQIAYLSNQLSTLIANSQNLQQGILNIGSGTVAGTSQNAANTRVNA